MLSSGGEGSVTVVTRINVTVWAFYNDPEAQGHLMSELKSCTVKQQQDINLERHFQYRAHNRYYYYMKQSCNISDAVQ